jgi:hypothetical protein
MIRRDGWILNLLGTFAGNLFKSRRRLEIENLFLRHQLHIALRRAPRRLRLRGCDRALLVWMTRRWPNLPGLACVVQPGTILRWHRETALHGVCWTLDISTVTVRNSFCLSYPPAASLWATAGYAAPLAVI